MTTHEITKEILVALIPKLGANTIASPEIAAKNLSMLYKAIFKTVQNPE